jgi:hypothetical protein
MFTDPDPEAIAKPDAKASDQVMAVVGLSRWDLRAKY